MKEEDAKKKVCPINFGALGISATLAKVNTDADDDHIKNIMKHSQCMGSECMMWEAEVVAEDIEIEIEPEDCVKKSESKAGHDYKFLRKSIKCAKESGHVVVELRRYVDSNSGDCGLKSKELYCEGCNN